MCVCARARVRVRVCACICAWGARTVGTWPGRRETVRMKKEPAHLPPAPGSRAQTGANARAHAHVCARTHARSRSRIHACARTRARAHTHTRAIHVGGLGGLSGDENDAVSGDVKDAVPGDMGARVGGRGREGASEGVSVQDLGNGGVATTRQLTCADAGIRSYGRRLL